MKKLIAIFTVVLFSTTVVLAQSSTKEAKPPSGLSEKEAYYLFYSNFRSDSYDAALTNGRWIMKGMPRKIEGFSSYDLATNLDRLITIYSEMAQMKTDPSLKTAYLDTVNMIYDKVFNTFSEDEIDYYQWHLNRGRTYYDNKDFMDNGEAKAAAEYEKAYKLNPKKVIKTADGYYVRVMLQNIVSKDTEEAQQRAITMMDKAEQYASDDLNSFFDKMRNKLFDTPEEQLTFLQQEVKENPQDTTALRQLGKIYEDQGNIKKAKEINLKLYELDPSYSTTVSLANAATQNAEYNTAIKYLKEASGLTDEPEKLKTIYQNLARAYLNKGQLRQARSNARKAIDQDSDWGRPYMTIASIYARAVSDCVENREMSRDDRAVYWLVMDYLNKAKNIDSSVASSANSQLRSYRESAPTQEDIFFVDSWSKGGSVRIDGSLGSCYSWINESTTVR